MTAIENKKKKKQIWREAKKELLERLPKKIKISICGMDNDSIYCHPELDLLDGFKLRGQIDVTNNHIYGWSLAINGSNTSNVYVDNDFWFLIENLESLKPEIIKAISEVEKIEKMKHKLSDVQNEIRSTFFGKKLEQREIIKSVQALFEVSEYIENQRLL